MFPMWEVAVSEPEVEDPQADEDVHVQEVKRRIGAGHRR